MPHMLWIFKREKNKSHLKIAVLSYYAEASSKQKQ